MEIYHIPHNITVFGNEVNSFPDGIGEAFDALIKILPKDDHRSYYGISWCIENNITYIAAAEQKKEGEAEKYECTKYTVEKGDYLSVPVYDWMSKTNCIKDVFTEIMKDERADNQTPAIEIYKNDKEMLCMVAVKRSIESLEDFISTTDALLKVIQEFDEEQINEIPHEGSWSAAQVIVHITKSNNGIAKAMKLDGEKITRDTDARVQELKNTFLDYTIKFKSPEFILPAAGPYEKAKVFSELERSIEQLRQTSKSANLSEAIRHPAFGEITKLELLYFVLFHTQRHTRQLKNIFSELNSKHYLQN
ncbi:DinB family protein [Panacibacter ginsenosidivorans]|uniref:DinB family protein n=1 Tax=Panacibacter ginsenosidivorans TaxID=1813871 RepID=A0A5B8V549_9BACT|nr:DinB family protein [Panacibacter ginsenosidivorans]QEC66510.1 DinB family protein [Panacibacter ginsenosidivorans]